ncbi:hypothetical protein C8F04DRAFT_1196278 [Mycena alexandri]|uniref:Alpha-type protein kinase domain-containing protein n=1 Tax=Mycena alexandri TaxID=1745969 RepID=A0AAD6S7U3_9AGAR|nr:hypothetical protein C8F04DRAFT_1196278 [Mycena alexandri]
MAFEILRGIVCRMAANGAGICCLLTIHSKPSGKDQDPNKKGSVPENNWDQVCPRRKEGRNRERKIKGEYWWIWGHNCAQKQVSVAYGCIIQPDNGGQAAAKGNTQIFWAQSIEPPICGTLKLPPVIQIRKIIGNTAADVMFDLTTHTTEGNSGVGDHGISGLTTFREQHECVSRCNKLNLGDLVDPNAADSEAEND